MLSFHEFLLEGNPLARMKKHADSGRHFVAISAERSSLPSSVNKKRHAALKKSLTKHGYGYREAEGSWEGVKERSVIVHAKQPGEHAGKKLKKDMSRLSKHYDQDSYLHHDSKEATLHGTNATGWPGRGKKDTVGRLSYNNPNSPAQTEFRPGKKKQPARFTTTKPKDVTAVGEHIVITQNDAIAMFEHFLESNMDSRPTNKLASLKWTIQQRRMFEHVLHEKGVIIL
jgi:hypothetical protein